MRRPLVLPLVSAVALSGCSALGIGGDDAPDPRDAARAQARTFLDAWAAGDLPAAAAATDAPVPAEEVLATTAERLSSTEVRATQGAVEGCGPEDDACTQSFTVTMALTAAGEWSYDSSLALVRTSGGGGGEDSEAQEWRVHWAPTVVHPALTQATRLGRVRELPARASILDRNGAPLTEDRPVVAVGVVPARLTDPEAVYTALQEVADVDPTALAARVATAGPEEFVDAVVLRQDEYVSAAARLELPGVVTRNGSRSLAPTAAFARGVLGNVAPPTAETLAEAGPTASTVDLVGASGLQRADQQQLAGTPGFQVVLIDTATDERVGEPLFTQEGTPGTPLTTTLDLAVQTAAEAAVAGATKTTALVAVDVATGGVLATANAPNAGDNRAFTGQYPPGSAFKVLTTAALLSAGVQAEEPVTCPATTVVDGKRFKNYEFSAFEAGDLALAFARSCNTAFVSLADRLETGALPEEAARFGLGTAWDVGVPAYSGSVPEPSGAVDEAAALIGQSRVLASPLAMAEVAAAVASGQPHAPTLVRPADGAAETSQPALVPLAPQVATALRSMMRATVTEGTASSLAGLGDVHAKTGTAEYGTQDPPATHAWLIGYRGDIAFAALVEDGASGSAEAAPVVARFLSALG